MPPEDTKILKFNLNQKSEKTSFIIYAGLEFLIEKVDGSKNNPENSSVKKVGEYSQSGFSLSNYHCL